MGVIPSAACCSANGTIAGAGFGSGSGLAVSSAYRVGGGVWCDADLPEVLNDPKHEDYEEMKERVGDFSIRLISTQKKPQA